MSKLLRDPSDTVIPHTSQNVIERLAAQYGSMQAARLRGDHVTADAAQFWLASIASESWHTIINDLRLATAPDKHHGR